MFSISPDKSLGNILVGSDSFELLLGRCILANKGSTDLSAELTQV
jgi:hypothetical protein